MRGNMNKAVTLFLAITYSTASAAVTLSGFNFSGTLLNDSSSTPMTGPVSLEFQILDPNGTCILYDETQPSVSLDSTGAFSVIVGSGNRASPSVDGGLNWDQVFSNRTQL